MKIEPNHLSKFPHFGIGEASTKGDRALPASPIECKHQDIFLEQDIAVLSISGLAAFP